MNKYKNPSLRNSHNYLAFPCISSPYLVTSWALYFRAEDVVCASRAVNNGDRV